MTLPTIGHQQRERSLRNEAAKDYEDWVRKTKGLLWDELEKRAISRAVAPSDNDTILDAGCGVGRHAFHLASRAKELVALDFSEESLNVLTHALRENPFITNIKTCLATLTAPLPISSGSVDKVLSSQVIQHIPEHSERVRAIHELKRVLKKGGLLVVTLYRWGGAVRTEKEYDGYC